MATLWLIGFFALIVGQPSLVQAACKVSPELWCDDPEIAAACGVTKECEEKDKPKDQLVDVALYYESMGSANKDFFRTPFDIAYMGVASIMNITLVPFGNSEITRNDSAPGGWQFKCEHGPDECFGNMIETCAIHLHQNVSVHYPFISCVMDLAESPKIAAKTCADYHKLDYTKLLDCVNSPLGVTLQHEMALKTQFLWPPHVYSPWITINGKHTEKMQKLANEALFVVVCQAYKGPQKLKYCGH